jgi:hypothetical protein
MKIRIAGAAGLLALTAPVAGQAAAPAAPVIMHHVRIAAASRIGNFGWSSGNWSGYAITGSGFTHITGAFNVPSVSATSGATYSSTWAGIDGFNNSNLIQAGTEQDYYSGSAHYNAWWEILPAAETRINSITVSPGDHMTIDIHQVSGSSWSITVTDTTNNQTFNTTQTYTGQLTSAEWIEEAPTVGGRIAPMAHNSLVTFDPGTVNGGNPGLTAADGGYLVQSRKVVEVPSNPDSDTDGFNSAYGNTQPAPPAS